VRYTIEFAVSVEDHLVSLTAAERRSALDAIEKRLRHEPLTPSRNRKPLRPNALAPWALRIGSLRVFYDVRHAKVRILAIGKKTKNVLRIGGRGIRL
jgi:mRNA-degrading endonuclease RelE of RelBE toxin-antitoxin system